MSESTKAPVISGCVLFILALGYGALGSWESWVADYHKHCENQCDLFKQIRAFVITKATFNLLTMVIFVITALLTCLDEKPKNSNNFISVLSLGVSIWGVVIYFDQLSGDFSDNNSELSSVVFVEMVLFFVSLGVGFVSLLGVCLATCCCEYDRKNHSQNNAV